MCGEHGRVNKGIPLEASARIPFLISYPGRIKPGTVIREAAEQRRFQADDSRADGRAERRGDEGRDASALFLTGRALQDWADVTFSRHSGGNWLMAATSRYKFIVSSDSDPCLFDLEADPFEMRNIFSAPPRATRSANWPVHSSDMPRGAGSLTPTRPPFMPTSPGPPTARRPTSPRRATPGGPEHETPVTKMVTSRQPR